MTHAAFLDDQKLFATCSLDGSLHIRDFANAPINRILLNQPLASVCFDPFSRQLLLTQGAHLEMTWHITIWCLNHYA